LNSGDDIARLNVPRQLTWSIQQFQQCQGKEWLQGADVDRDSLTFDDEPSRLMGVTEKCGNVQVASGTSLSIGSAKKGVERLCDSCNTVLGSARDKIPGMFSTIKAQRKEPLIFGLTLNIVRKIYN
jgi:hypothetical protein